VPVAPVTPVPDESPAVKPAVPVVPVTPVPDESLVPAVPLPVSVPLEESKAWVIAVSPESVGFPYCVPADVWAWAVVAQTKTSVVTAIIAPILRMVGDATRESLFIWATSFLHTIICLALALMELRPQGATNIL